VLRGTREQLVVVPGDADDLEVPRDGQERSNTFADDEIVVREDDADHWVRSHWPTLVIPVRDEMGLPPRSSAAVLTFCCGPCTLDAGFGAER